MNLYRLKSSYDYTEEPLVGMRIQAQVMTLRKGTIRWGNSLPTLATKHTCLARHGLPRLLFLFDQSP